MGSKPQSFFYQFDNLNSTFYVITLTIYLDNSSTIISQET